MSYTLSRLESLSNIPSQPRTMKSCSLFILKALISGVAIKTFGFPPNFSIFASTSPNDLLTDNRPGNMRAGPY